MNYTKNKQAFGQSKKDTSTYGNHYHTKTEREMRRKEYKSKKLTKDQILQKEYVRFLEEAYSQNRNIPEIKYLKKVPAMWGSGELELVGEMFEFVEFVEPERDPWSSSYTFFTNQQVIIKSGDKKMTFVRFKFEPVVLEEDFILWKIKKQIGL